MAAISGGNVITSLEPPSDQVSIMEPPVFEMVVLQADSHSNVDSSLNTDTAVDNPYNSPPADNSVIGTKSFYGKSKHRLSPVGLNRSTVDNVQGPPRKKCKPARYYD